MAAAETQVNGDSDIRDAADMYNNKDKGVRYTGWWRWRRMITSRDKQVKDEIRTRHAR